MSNLIHPSLIRLTSGLHWRFMSLGLSRYLAKLHHASRHFFVDAPSALGIAILAFGVLLAPLTSHAQNVVSWEKVAPPAFIPKNARNPSFAVSTDGTPYLAYSDTNTQKLIILRLNSESQYWEPLGMAGLSVKTSNPLLALSADGTPYVAYSDSNLSDKVSVLRYSSISKTWQTLGTPAFTAGSMDPLALAVSSNGTPYVAYVDTRDADKLTLRYYDSENNSWATKATEIANIQTMGGLYLALSADGTAYVAYSDDDKSGNATVVSYNPSKDLWDTVGQQGFSADAVSELSLAVSSKGTVYVAYSDSDRDNAPTVMSWSNGGSWEAVGTETLTDTYAEYLTLALDANDTLYLSYEHGSTDSQARVIRLGESDRWITIGTLDKTATPSLYLSLGISAVGTPYLAYQVQNLNSLVSVFRLDNGWKALGTQDFYPEVADDAALALDAEGTPYMAYSDKSNGNKVTVVRLSDDGYNWTPVGLAGFSEQNSSNPLLVLSSDGTPYVAYLIDKKVTVMRYNRGANTWEAVGTSGLPNSSVYSLQLAMSADDDIPYVSYVFSSSDDALMVMRLNSNNTWETVGPTNLTGLTAFPYSLAVSRTGMPYIAYANQKDNYNINVIRLTSTNTWEAVGSSGFAKTRWPDLTLALSADATPYVSFSDESANDAATTVMRLDSNTWEVVGIRGFNPATVYQTVSLTLSSTGIPYVAFKDGQMESKASVMRYNSTNSNWELVGEPRFSDPVSNSNEDIKLALSQQGMPYIAYQDESSDQTIVMRFAEPGISLPGAPTDVMAEPGINSATLTFNAPVNTGGDGVAITGYTVTSTPAGASCTVTINTSSSQQTCTATGLDKAQSYTFSVKAINKLGASPPASSNAVIPFAPLDLTLPSNQADAQLGETYSLQLSAVGGSGTYSYALTGSNQLPPGITINDQTGVLSGTPTAVGEYPVTFSVTDSQENSKDLEFVINVTFADVKVPAADQVLPDAIVGILYEAQIRATGGTGEYTFALKMDDQLPAGLNLNPQTGAITGTPTMLETAEFSITITDLSVLPKLAKAGGVTEYSTTQAFSILVRDAAVTPSTVTPVPALGAMGLLLLNAGAALMLGMGMHRRKRKAIH